MEVQTYPEGFQKLSVTAVEWEAAFDVSGECPVQAFGTVGGRDLYFRARHGEWWCEIADSNGNLPSDGYFSSDGFYREGLDPHNGYMPLPDAVVIIANFLKEYTGIDATPSTLA